jgi:hypothetical protein
MRSISVLSLWAGLLQFGAAITCAQEFLVDPGFEDTQGLGAAGAPWREPLFADPVPDVNATVDPRNGLEHAIISYDSNQSGAFGPTIGSSAYVGFGPAENITDFTGMTFTVEMHYKVVANNMVSPNPANAPSILIRNYVSFYSDQFGFLGYGGFAPDFPADVYVEGTNSEYQTNSYQIQVPNFGTAVTSIEYTLGLVAPLTDDFRVMTGTATVYFDDASLSIPGIPGDYNDDGIVDAADYVIWRKNLGTSFQLSNEDPAVTPGMVTSEDFDVWQAHFGDQMGPGAGSSISPVPEPATIVQAIVTLVVFSVSSRWHGRHRCRI